ncbi:uncharacterized protein [Halyomorpha halys]|uniref:uncharacterized protein n=1 Tax=Halyomorpha halys TaxID=286706 RepID=UPI0006D5065A|nr:uncharacterized protein LOC106677442 [Halyomorpha halys]XP_014270864.1 uncharacterized protein LOC106677442 [Halyomorpha halys]
MKKIMYSTIQVLIFVITAVLVSTNPTNQDINSPTTSAPSKDVNVTKDELVKSWPKVFYLSMDPNDPIVCYSGVKFNFTENENKTTSPDEKNNQQIFTLSKDPLFPVTCRRGPIPVSLTDTLYVEEESGGNSTNVTCVRRDYEKNISAIFIHQAGPLHTAVNIFNSSLPYGFMTATATDVSKVDEKKVLKEFEVDCEEYGIDTGDKGLCPGLAASLCG